MTLDRPEEIVATKRTQRWTKEDREWLDDLPENERELVRLAVAHLDARPVDAYEPDDPKHETFHDRYADVWDAREGK